MTAPMPDLPEEALQAAQDSAEDALRRWFHGEGYTARGHYENPGECSACNESAEVAVKAAAPVIAAQARAQALRDRFEGRVSLEEQAAAQGHTGPQRIEDLSSSLPFSEAEVQAYFAAMEDHGPSYEDDIRAAERRKVAEEIATALELRAEEAGHEARRMTAYGAPYQAEMASSRAGVFADGAAIARQIGDPK